MHALNTWHYLFSFREEKNSANFDMETNTVSLRIICSVATSGVLASDLMF